MPDVLMPRLSDTMTEGVIGEWLKREGDVVQRGDTLAEIETDKATMELEAYDSGVLTRIIAPAGSTVPIGQPIAVIGDPTLATDTEPVAEQAVSTAVTDSISAVADTPASVAAPAEPAPTQTSTAAEPMRATPLVRKLAREHGIELTDVTGTGPGGRIVRADIEAVVGQRPGAARPAASAVGSTANAEDDEQVPLSSIRRITAQRLTESAAAPHFYLTSVADAEALQKLRAQLNADFCDTGPKISVTDLLIRACAVTLRTHLHVNSSWGGDHLVRHSRVNIGCAVATDNGLLVPVIRDADRKSLTEIAVEEHTLVARARVGKLAPDELTGSTFTISNLGMYGIDHFTAIINPPEAAVLAVGAVQEEAVVRDGQLTAATTLKLTLSIDHRVLDGAIAALFLQELVNLIEHPLHILM
ncbi:MAG: dihydrolipoamide acetyltransferase family protein [Mycobacterium sp.]|uniref:dihydrolipoamide acetyltransferase family protein n=1 Tax=Mycobacterium sp. TaxID=1785 RepID=UPI003C55F3B3